MLPTQAQEALKLGHGFEELWLGKELAVLEDAEKKLHLGNVIHRRFRHNTKKSLNFGFTNSYFWIRFRLKNTDSLPKSLFLEVGNPHINKLQLYTFTQGKQSNSLLTGDHFPFSQRPVQHPHFLFPIVLQPSQEATYYLWVDKHGEQLQVPLRLCQQGFFFKNDYKINLFWGAMLSISALYSLLSIILVLFFRNKLNLYYCLYACSSFAFLVAHTGLGFRFFYPETPWLASAMRPTCAIFLYIFSLQIARSFLGISAKHRFLNAYTKSLTTSMLCLFVILWLNNPKLRLVEAYWYNPVYYEGAYLLIYMKTINLLVTFTLVSLPLMGVYFYLRERKADRIWFTVGSFLLLTGGTVTILVFAGYIPYNYYTENAPLLSNVLETIILSFLLANRFKNIYQQNAEFSAELAIQRQRNALQLLEGQHIERKRLSQELHDGISLTLANIRLRLSILADRFKPQPHELANLVDELGEVGQDIRQFSHALSPALLERRSLAEALQDLAHRTQLAHPTLRMHLEIDELSESNIQHIVLQSLYQIAAELLNNVAKHARASEVSLCLKRNNQQIMLEIQDDGVGYDVSQKARGIGLQNIRSRISLLNGIFEVTLLSKGMRHTIQIPAHTSLFS